MIFKRLLDIVLKIDNIKTTETGEAYLDLDSLHTDANLADKYKSICLLWDGTGEEKKQAQEKSWTTVLEAVERDIISLNNDFKFRQLAD